MPAPDEEAASRVDVHAPTAAPLEAAPTTATLLWLVAGWSLGAFLPADAPQPRATPRCTLQTEPLPCRPPSTRAWRGVPGVGRRRALALARAYWRAGPAFEAERVPGVGPVTGAAVRRFLEGHP